MSKVVLSLGSNMGDSLGNLRMVQKELGDKLIASSSIYKTKPWGYTDQNDFLNAVLIADDPELTPEQWLEFADDCEIKADRVRTFENGPRSLDVDIVAAFQDDKPVIQKEENLILPHPKAKERLFVLLPWLEINPKAIWFDKRNPGGIGLENLLMKFSAGDILTVEKTNFTWN